ncbi:OprD family outer membrane porin [Cesiribacter andamanensis]|uniref:Outer membrane porin, OprD family n=1 Tax=Cesiribacter andamanensis AMV16 TaxID=1279009 RepID=M7NY81_9BACT|nr:OprD family outer membrane porin [Cesiribacter andamanensis]EMR03324.1 outer membrane porin, OprD family [Cesiribacter andamanensis AMV16]
MKSFLLLAALLSLGSWHIALAQDAHPAAGTPPAAADTSSIKSLKDFFARGSVHGHVRNYFMASWNYRQLSDNYANALGAGLAYQTAAYKGLRLGIGGLFTYRLFSSGMSERDPITGKYPRLELELFDLEDPENGTDLDRLDELYLEYRYRHLLVRGGRFSFSSPLMNPQDTRMKPYSFQGIALEAPLGKKAALHLAWFDHVSPRSAVSWFSTAESIGLYAAGVDVAGNPSAYRHQTRSRGVAVAGLQSKLLKGLEADVWNYWIENIANTTYGRSQWPLHSQVSLGLEGLYQFRVGTGGNPESSLAYFPDQQQWLGGSRLAYTPGSWELSLNYLHIGRGGRFLFPREWGREQFFATLPRGRMEGLGKANLLVAKVKYTLSEHFLLELALARGWTPATEEYRFNKYGTVSYWSWVSDLRYQPANPALKGLSFRLLYIGRISPTDALAVEEMYYRTNFHNLNLITQISF